MTRLGKWSALAVAIVVGLVVGTVSAFTFVHSHKPQVGPPGDRVRAAIAVLKKDHFYVSPELQSRITPAQQQAISAALSNGRTPAYLVYWTSSTDAGYYLDYDALDQIMGGVGKDGHYAIVDEDLTATAESRGMADPFVDPDLLVARPAAGLLAYGDAMARAKAEPVASSGDYWGGPGGGLAAGVLFAGGGFLVLLLLVAFVGWLRPGRRSVT